VEAEATCLVAAAREVVVDRDRDLAVAAGDEGDPGGKVVAILKVVVDEDQKVIEQGQDNKDLVSAVED
jgi:hypothetical protein